jgi:hypothetical protein
LNPQDSDAWAGLGGACRRKGNLKADLTPKTATENFRSVLHQLTFLQQNNQSIQGIAQIIDNIYHRMTTAT